ncbi:oxidoreductase [Pseudomonas sp. NPDC089554]|uniref:oxidoreductase n=1 Tax=Pseudomonas sp. NPDC089554 TaxID=3390653 RepID=UPI003CFC22AA
MTAPSTKPVWFITGCSTGFGRELASHLLQEGYRVVVTARRLEQVDEWAARYPQQALALALDVSEAEQVKAAVSAAESHFGQIDVLVNNAGIGYFGALEESDEAEVRRMFEINVWGLAAMTRAVLPGMRKRRAGSIVNLSSVGGLVALPALSFYNASKFAVEALSESLAQEVAPLGIRVLLIEPGPFRTDWAGRSAGQRATVLDDYAATAGARLDTIRGYSGQQPGDPKRAAVAIVNTVEAPTAPLRLLLGQAAVNSARSKLRKVLDDIDTWEAVSIAADFPKA